jgi:hypothetical protein
MQLIVICLIFIQAQNRLFFSFFLLFAFCFLLFGKVSVFHSEKVGWQIHAQFWEFAVSACVAAATAGS